MPYMKNGKRDYKREDQWDANHPGRLKQREARHVARAHMMKAGKVHKGDNLQVDHKTPLSKGGSKKDSNLRVVSTHFNESFHRTKTGAIRGKTGR